MPDVADYRRQIELARTAGLRISAQATAELLELLEEYADELAARVAAGLARRGEAHALLLAREIIRQLVVDLARVTNRNVRLSAERVAEIHANAVASLISSGGAAAAGVSASLGGIGVSAAQAVLSRPQLAASFRSIRTESIEAVDRIIKRALLRGTGADKLALELRAHILGADAFPGRLLLDRRRIGYAVLTELGYEPTPANLAAVRADVGRIADRARLIARTEPMNAEHEAGVRSAAASPVVGGLRWRNSNSRQPPNPGAPCPVCRLLQDIDWFGLGEGVFHPARMPPRPHPRCLCRFLHIILPVSQWGRSSEPPAQLVEVSEVAHIHELSPSQEAMLERALDAARQRIGIAA